MSAEPLGVKDASGQYLVASTQRVGDLDIGRAEAGNVPEGWGMVSLFTIAGESKSRFDDGDWVEAEFLTASGVRLLQTGNIGVGQFIDKEVRKYISDTSFEQLGCKDVYPGDLLICRLADPAGRACIAPDLGESRVITAVDVTIFRPVSKLADSRFLLQYLCTPRWFKEVSERCGGSTRTRIARGELAKIKVPLPGIPEQQVIGEALSDVDALLEALDALIAKKRAIKQAAMQHLLTGKIRLPGFCGEWKAGRLGMIGQIRGGAGFPTKFQGAGAGTFPFFKVSDMNNAGNETHMRVANNYIDEHVRKSLGAVAFPAGSIVFAKVGAAVFLERKRILSMSSCLDNNMAALVVDESVADYRFVHYSLLNTSFGDLVSTTALPSLSGKVLSEISCPLPSIEEQASIAEALSSFDAEIGALERRRDKTRAIKQGMMQQLLTGRVRLVPPSAAATEGAT